MFHGFDPATRDLVFERRNRRSLIVAGLAYLALFGSWVALDRSKEKTVEVLLEPEIKDFAVEEEPEPEPEEEPPPPPPEVAPKPKADKPKPKPKPEVPKVIPEGPPPEQEKPAEDKSFGTGQNPGAGTGKPKVEKKPEVKKPEVKKPEPPKPAAAPIDPTKPIDRPERSDPPKADPGNKLPEIPAAMRDAGVEGEVVMKIHVHMDGTVKGAKILRSTNTATGEEEKAAMDKAMKAAVIAMIKGWKFTPCKLDGQAISVWVTVTFPFKLNAG
jgi:periplasmic protein TonB